jgi:hypothetical protein
MLKSSAEAQRRRGLCRPQAEALEVNVADVVEVRRFESPGISSTFGDPGNQVTALMLSMLCWRT